MKIEEENPLKAYAKKYFKDMLDNEPINLRFGNELKMRIDFFDERGNQIKGTEVTVKRDELYDYKN